MEKKLQKINAGSFKLNVQFLHELVDYWQSLSQAIPSLSASLALHPQVFNWYCASAQDDICGQVLEQLQV